MTGRLGGKVAVVTGAGNGIGQATAERFAAEGAAVVAADLQRDRVDEVVAAIGAGGGRAIAATLDAASREDNQAVIDLATSTYGGLDVLVTAAGISHGEYVSGDIDSDIKRVQERMERMDQPWLDFLEMDPLDWQKVLDVNLTGTMYAAQAAARVMVESGRGGSIVTIASIAAKDPSAGPLAYCTSKAGVWMFSKHLARSLGPAGIRVNAIGPGFIETNMTAMTSAVEGMDELLMMRIPMLRKGRPEEVAAMALFLASDEASYVSGTLMHPHGGWFTD